MNPQASQLLPTPKARPAHTKYQLQAHLRDALSEHPDGLTARELMALTLASESSVHRALKTCSGVYIDRWHASGLGPWGAVFCLGDLPNCPKPTIKPKDWIAGRLH